MGAGNAIVSGDECYSTGQFDDAIKYYTQAANQGYVEGMEKLLKTCVEQGREHANIFDEHILEYWGKASKALRSIMTHKEISKEVKDRAYKYYDEIMYGIAIEYILSERREEARLTFGKIAVPKYSIGTVVKAYCEYSSHSKYAKDIANEALDKMNLSPEERKKTKVPFVTDEIFQAVFQEIAFLNQLKQEQITSLIAGSSVSEKWAFGLALVVFISLYCVGHDGAVEVIKKDENKAFQCWKVFDAVRNSVVEQSVIEPEDFLSVHEVIEEYCRKRLQEGTTAVIEPAPQPTPQPKHVHESPVTDKKVDYDSISRRITINRPKKMEGWTLKVQVYVDGVEKATIKNGESTVIVVDGREHQLCCVLPSSAGTKKCEEYIPAGSKNHTFDIDMKAKQLISMKALQFEAPKQFEYALKLWVKFCASWGDSNKSCGVYILVDAYTQGPKKGTIEMSIGGENHWRLCVAKDIPEADSYIYGDQGSGYMMRGFTFYEPDCYIFGCPQDAFEEYDVRGNAPNAYMKSYKKYTDNIHIEINFTEPDDDHEMYNKFVECCRQYCYYYE